MRKAGGEGGWEHWENRANSRVQKELVELPEGEMQQEPIGSAPHSPREMTMPGPSSCSSYVHVPTCVSPSCLQMTWERENMKGCIHTHTHTQSFKVGSNKTMRTKEKKQNSHLNGVRGVG